MTPHYEFNDRCLLYLDQIQFLGLFQFNCVSAEVNAELKVLKNKKFLARPYFLKFRARTLEHRIFRRTWKWNDISYIRHTGNVHQHSLKAQTKPCMWKTSVTT